MAGQKFNAFYGLSCDKNGVSQDITNAYFKGQPVAVLYGGTNLTATPASGQLLIGNGSGYTLSTITAGTGITVTNTSGSITIAATNAGSVTSVTGDSPINVTNPTTGVYNVALNTVPVASGGTGTVTGSITGTGALTFTAGGTNTNVVLTPNGTGSVDVSSKKITSVADPTVATDAATKSYVDSVAQGLDVKASVKYASTGNLALSGTAITNIDVPSAIASLTVGDRVLAKDQTTGTQNGIYVVAAGAWTRATDMAAGSDASGAFTFVQYGSSTSGSLADTGWVQTADPAVVGTDALVWTQFSGVGNNASTISVTNDTSTNSFIYPTLTSSTSGAATIKTSSSRIAVNTSNGQLKLNNVATTYAAQVSVDASGGSATTIDTFTGSGAKYLLHCYQYYNGLGGAEARSTVELLVNVTGTAGSFGVQISEYGMSNSIVTYDASVNSSTGLVTVTAIGLNASPNVYTVALQRVAFGLYTNS